MVANEYDYVIVGGGSAGAVLARRLADRDDANICLIEGGESREHDRSVLMLNESLALVGNPDYDYDYTIAEQSRGNSDLRLSRARILGGCSAHNDSWALRPPAEDLDGWAAAGAEGWDAASMSPHFDRIMQEMRVHGVPQTSPLSHAWVEAAKELGIGLVDGPDAELSTGIAWTTVNEDDGVRVSTAVAYLFPLAELSSRITLRLATRALRIVTEGDRAVAVQTDRGEVRARREIIVSAGAIDSPRLLMLSGIGPASHLHEVGVDPRVDVPGVGENLQDHIETAVHWELRREPGPSLNGLDLAIYAPMADGGRFEMQNTLGHFLYPLIDPKRVAPWDELPNVERVCYLAPNVAKPRSRGTVRLRSADPHDKPVVDPRYFTDPDNHDEQVLIEGIRLARRLADTGALADWLVREAAPGPAVSSDSELGAFARRYSNTVYHPTCTCKIGADDDPLAVVDSRLRVRGVDGLRVADASVFPDIVRVNTNMTAVAVGSKAAELLGEEYS